MLCYDEHGLELDYHDDVPTTDSRESLSCSHYLDWLLDEEHATPPADTTQPPATSEETVPPEITPTADATATSNTGFGGWSPFLQEHFGVQMDVEDLLQGPTEQVTEAKETVLLDETLTIKSDELPTDAPREPTPEPPAAKWELDEPTWSREIFKGLQNLTLDMLADSLHPNRPTMPVGGPAGALQTTTPGPTCHAGSA